MAGCSRKWPRIVVGATVVLSVLATPAAVRGANAATTTAGYRDFSYTGTTAPTADKAQSKLWCLDAGFPLTIGQGQTEGVVIDRDSTGVVWATFVVNGKVKVTHTNGSDAVWVKPYLLPVGTAANVKPEPEGDVSAIVHYGGTKTG